MADASLDANAGMFAIVRYIDDPSNKYVVATSSIKDFHPQNFDKAASYNVWWDPPAGSKNSANISDYYPAQVLLLDATRENLEKRMKEKRIHVPKLPQPSDKYGSKGHIHNEKSKEEIAAKETIKDTRCKVSATARKALTGILKEAAINKRRKKPIMDRESSSSDNVSSGEEELMVKKTQLDEKDQKYDILLSRCKKLHAEKEHLRELNEKLQLALVARVLQHTEREDNDYANVYCNVEPEVPSTFPLPECNNYSVDTPNDELQQMQEQQMSPQQKSMTQGPFEPQICANKVDLGGVFVDIAQWKNINQKAKTPSLFCKELALAMWGPEMLRNRSVTGGTCNANKNKSNSETRPALTPHKLNVILKTVKLHLEEKGLKEKATEMDEKKVNGYIREKIQDLRKKP